jgi:hypothetical protein
MLRLILQKKEDFSLSNMTMVEPAGSLEKHVFKRKISGK